MGNFMDDDSVDKGRRNFLKAMIVLSAGVAAASVVRGVIGNVIAPRSGLTSFPTMTLVNSSTNKPVHTADLENNSSIAYVFYYPLQNDPNFLIRLRNKSGQDVTVLPSDVLIPASGTKFKSPPGVGPFKSVISFSAICEHLGCVVPIIHYYPGGATIPGHPTLSNETGYIHCSCHGSTYDPLHGAAVVTGPTQKPLPNVILDYDALTDTYKVKMMTGPTIYSKPNDLSGGTPFPSGTTTTGVGEVAV